MRGTVTIGIALGVSVCRALAGQEQIPRTRVAEDVRYLVRALEETHPDPYSAFGGKVAFKLRARDLLAAIPADGLSADGLYTLLGPFLAELGDGHTSLRPPAHGGRRPARYLPVAFGVAADATFVTAASPGYEELIGARLVAVEDMPLAQFALMAERILPSENAYGAARSAARALQSTRYMRQLLPLDPDTLRVQLLDRDGMAFERRIPFLASDAPDPARPNRPWAELWPDRNAIWWRYLESSGAGYLRLESIESREAFEGAKGRQDLPQYVEGYYRRYLHRDPPADIDSAIAGVPCFTESVAALLATMRAKRSEYLVVDLRRNGGGWSSLGLALYLLVYGNDYLDHAFPEVWVDVASPRLLELNDWTADDLRAEWGDGYEIGDYRRTAAGAPRAGRTTADFAADLRPYGCRLAERALEIGESTSYRPTVIVLVDTGTFSAAFQLAYHLWHLGAVLVGVPPAQAGNAFTNVVPVELPNSHLGGSIARSAQIYFPDDPEGGRVLTPDFPMTWALYARYGFDAQSEVRYALDLIAAGRVHPARDP